MGGGGGGREEGAAEDVGGGDGDLPRRSLCGNVKGEREGGREGEKERERRESGIARGQLMSVAMALKCAV